VGTRLKRFLVPRNDKVRPSGTKRGPLFLIEVLGYQKALLCHPDPDHYRGEVSVAAGSDRFLVPRNDKGRSSE
jgi:hypothetical protein